MRQRTKLRLLLLGAAFALLSACGGGGGGGAAPPPAGTACTLAGTATLGSGCILN